MKNDGDIIAMRRVYIGAIGVGLMIGILFPLYSATFLGLRNIFFSIFSIYYIVGSLIIGLLIGILSYIAIKTIMRTTFHALHKRMKNEIGIRDTDINPHLKSEDYSIFYNARDGDEIERLREDIFDIFHTIGKTVRDIKGLFKVMEESYLKISMDIKERGDKIDKDLSSVNNLLSFIEQKRMIDEEIHKNTLSISSILANLSSSIIEMTASTEEVAEKSERLSSSLMDTSSSIEEMATSVKEVANNIEFLSVSAEETGSAISDIDTSIKGVEKNARISLKMSTESSADAEDGKRSVIHTIEGMKRIKEVIEDSANIIFVLGKRSKEIGDILKVIEHVAEKTNLLAVNAGILAAHAGEHTGGFGVIATEIRELADRTASSIKEISKIIKTVQKESLDAVERIKVASKSGTEGVRLSTQAGEALDKILHSIDRSKEMADQIAIATSDQTEGSRVVRDAIENVTNLLKQMTKATREQASASEQIIKATGDVMDTSGEIKRITIEQAKCGDNIKQMINEVTEKIRDISRGIEEQRRGGEEIIRGVKDIAMIMKEDTDNTSMIYSDLKGVISGDRLKGCLCLFNDLTIRE
ncbi:MAG: hypothetical protein HY999_01555 [Nitrospinae bacterium]|nr:hypothetical protein [Nitrospinota bacterium]